MNIPLIAAAIVLALIGLAHSVIGEQLIFRPLRTRGVVPTGGQPVLRERQTRILWASWHPVTAMCWGFCVLLWQLAEAQADQAQSLAVAPVTATVILVGAAMVFFSTRGRHPAWAALLVVSVLIWWR